MSSLTAAVERGDPDELLRVVDGLCEAREWDRLVELKQRCLHAVERGKQLWGVAEHVDYRLALEAPGRWAGPVIVEGAGRFTLGPLPEVAASTHTWADLEPYIPDGPLRAVTAHERVVRGEDLRGAVVDDVLETPLRLLDWEPVYPVATYHATKVEVPAPDLPAMEAVELPPPGERIDHVATEALLALTDVWTDQSNGRSDVVAVRGTALEAVAALGPRTIRTGPTAPAQAMAWMAWAAASGGAYGRRRGAAAGRFGAWWAIAALTDADWPVDDLEPAALRWYAWSDLVPPTGWTLHLAMERADGMAWAISAVDAD